MTGQITHHTIVANGISMHVAEQGSGPLVLLCHGWPETWYSWRHQIPVLAREGFRIVAPDLRGFGRTDAPHEIEAYNIFCLVGDLVDLIAKLGEERAIVIGHDWGAALAWHAALFRPDVFTAVASLSIPFRQRGADAPTKLLRAAGLETFYWIYFQSPGVAEAEFERDTASTLRRLYYTAAGGTPVHHRMKLTLAAGAGLLDQIPEPPTLPAWLTAADLETMTREFERSGFRAGLNWYRNIDRNWQLTAPWHGAKISVPALFIAGTEEPVLHGPTGQSALQNMTRIAPGLMRQVLIDGGGHWIQEEYPAEVNAALVDFVSVVEGNRSA